MVDENIKQKAQTFKQLHQSNHLFVLPNPWDVGSANC